MTTSLVHLASSFVGGDQESFVISGRLYTVTLGFAAQDAPEAAFAGEITASVQVGDATQTASTPEPASLVLAGMAFPAIGVSRMEAVDAAARLRPPFRIKTIRCPAWGRASG